MGVSDRQVSAKWGRTARRARVLRQVVLLLVVTSTSAFGILSHARAENGVPTAQSSPGEELRIGVASRIIAEPASQAPLNISIAPGAPPNNTFLRVKGLPPMVLLSAGYATAPGSWTVPLNALATLQMIVPAGVSGRTEIIISLVSEDGMPLAEAKAALVIGSSASQAIDDQTRIKGSAPPPTAMLSPADRENAEKLIARGERELDQGQIAVARNFFLRAAQIGLARAAILLAATYDPRELARWGVRGVQPNLGEARKWYERAQELGAPEAEERLARLGGN
jgi:hypothetical protein